MKILVSGSTGQLGKDLVEMLLAVGQEVVAISSADVDFTRPNEVHKVVFDCHADWVINCAAYTQVDQAESQQRHAFLVNRDSAERIAQAVQLYGGKLLHLSTDFVFDGQHSEPYKETHEPNPLSVYGRSKLEGEQRIIGVGAPFVILRTAWVYGSHGSNFVKTILRLIKQRDCLTVVDDQIGTPTWTRDIAETIIALLNADANGIFHFTNEGVASWYDFAMAIQRVAGELGLDGGSCEIRPIPSTEFPTPAERPKYAVLSKERVRTMLSEAIPHWEKSLWQMMKEFRSA